MDPSRTMSLDPSQPMSLDFFAECLRRSGLYTVAPVTQHSQTFNRAPGANRSSSAQGSQTYQAAPGSQTFQAATGSNVSQMYHNVPPPSFNPLHSTPAYTSRSVPGPSFATAHPHDKVNKTPTLPDFWGKPGDDFDLFLNEINCLQRGQRYSDHALLEAVRNGLKGKARTVLLHLGEQATLPEILQELEGIYGDVRSTEKTKEQFYAAVQETTESVADYSLRLEQLIRRCGQLNAESKDEMLRNRLWSGLHDDMLQNMSRYKYESIRDFNTLRKELRKMEAEMKGMKSKSGVKVESETRKDECQVESNMTRVESKLLRQMEEMTKEMKKLGRKVDSLEKEVEAVKGTGKKVEDGQKKFYEKKNEQKGEKDNKSLNGSRPPKQGR